MILQIQNQGFLNQVPRLLELLMMVCERFHLAPVSVLFVRLKRAFASHPAASARTMAFRHVSQDVHCGLVSVSLPS